MQRQNQTTLNVNAEGFISCDSAEHVYLLGFIWADGYILNTKKTHAKTLRYAVRIEIIASDMDKIKPVLEKTGR